MSNYYIKAKNKNTGEVKDFYAIDDFYGKHRYGYEDNEGTTYDEDRFNLMFEVLAEKYDENLSLNKEE